MRWSAAALLVLLCACRGEDPDTLVVVGRIPLPGPGFETLAPDGGGGWWLGGAGEMVRIDAAGEVVARAVVGEGAAPAVVGVAPGGGILAWTGTSALALSPAGDSVVAERGGMRAGPVAVDPRGRYLFRSDAAGAVVAHDAVSLEPIWGWGAVGAEAGGLAVSPEGDRVYEALRPETAGNGELLVRDLQTGRILRRIGLPEPAHALAVGADGAVHAVTDGAVMRLDWSGGDLVVVWRRSFADLRVDAPPRLRVEQGGRRLAVLGGGTENGLHVLDAETGRTIGRLRGEARDVAFDGVGGVYLLHPAEIRGVQE